MLLSVGLKPRVLFATPLGGVESWRNEAELICIAFQGYPHSFGEHIFVVNVFGVRVSAYDFAMLQAVHHDILVFIASVPDQVDFFDFVLGQCPLRIRLDQLREKWLRLAS